jgi:Kelch motif
MRDVRAVLGVVCGLVLGMAVLPSPARSQSLQDIPGNTWTRMSPRILNASGQDVTMPWNAYSGLVYNPDIVGIMMFGGGGHGGRRGNDVWIYDITANQWRQQYAPDDQSQYPYSVDDTGMTFDEYCQSTDPLVCNPPTEWLPRGTTRTGRPWTSHSYDQMAYDAYNHKYVYRAPNFCFGYNPPHYYGVPDAFTYDVASKQWAPMANFPNIRAQTGSAEWDPDHNMIVTIGGSWAKPGFSYLGTRVTWIYDAVQRRWSQRPNPPPDNFSDANMVFDTVNRCMLIYGGDYTAKSDLWRYKTSTDTWTKLAPLPDPVHGLPPAGAPFAAFDSRNGILLIWGEGDTGGFIPTWAYDVRTNLWKKMNPIGGEPASRANVGANMVYDPVNNVFFLLLIDGSFWAYRYGTAGGSNDGVAPAKTFDLRIGSATGATALYPDLPVTR